MSPVEFWRLFDRRVGAIEGVKKNVPRKARELSEADKQAALQQLKDYREKHGRQ